MKTDKQVDFMHNFNNVAQGLNFLVPSFWWDEFYQKNMNAHHYHQIQLPEMHPLEILFSCQVIQQQPIHEHLPNLRRLRNAFQQGWKVVDNDLKKRKEQMKGKLRRGRTCDWWTEGDLAGTFQLFSPDIKWSTLEDMGMKDMSWQVVSPQLYRYFTDNYQKKCGFSYGTLTAIPVFVHPNQQTSLIPYYIQRERIHTQVISFSFNRSSFIFSGYVENNVTVTKLTQWINQGLRIWSMQDVEGQKNSVFFHNKKVYYDFFDGGINVEGLKWESFSKLARKNVSNLMNKQIVEYSYQIGGKEQDQTQRQQPVKKLKTINPATKIHRKKITKGKMVRQQANEKERDIPYEIGGKIRYIKIPRQNTPIRQLNTSAEAETPQEKPQIMVTKDGFRIPYKMFEANQVNEYRKTSEIKMNHFISILETDNNAIRYPRQTIQEAQIELNYNHIRVNQQGIFEQIQDIKKERRPSEDRLDDETSKNMEKLISELMISSKKPNIEQLKQTIRSNQQPSSITNPKTAINPTKPKNDS